MNETIFSDERWPAIRDLAVNELGVKPDTARKWREFGCVPGKWHLPLLRSARQSGIVLTDDDLLSQTSRG